MNDTPFSALQSLKPPESEVEAFESWLKNAPGGSIFHYFTGTWIEERKRHDASVYIHSEDTRAVAKAAREACERGEVELMQRRNANGKLGRELIN